MFYNLWYYLQRVWQLGWWKSWQRLWVRATQSLRRLRDRLCYRVGSCNLDLVASQDLLANFANLAQKYRSFLLKHQPLQTLTLLPEVPKEKLIFGARGKALLFGKLYQLPSDEFSFWHTDWLLGQNSSTKKLSPDATRWYAPQTGIPFFADVKITGFMGNDLLGLGKDIKVPWETGRMQYLSWCAFASAKTGCKKTHKRACRIIFKTWWSFLRNCPCLGGVQWENPMEVGIRAVNIIFTLLFLRCRRGLLLEKLLAILGRHQEFIESYLESSATPNNHYLADLTALLYLKLFVGQFTAEKMRQELTFVWQEFGKQLLADGTFYEGSSAYHRLNLEMLLHVCYLDEFLQTGVTDKSFVKEQVAPLFFACASEKDYLKIGDDDSARFVFGLGVINFPAKQLRNPAALFFREFREFGLIVVRDAAGANLISLRIPPPFDQGVQPSGHFHDDAFAVTLRLDGEEILVDPGSGVYTASVALRNLLRQAASHTRFGLSIEPLLGKELFVTKLPKFSQIKVFRAGEKNENEEIFKLGVSARMVRSWPTGQGTDLLLVRRLKIVVQNQAVTRIEILDTVDLLPQTKDDLPWVPIDFFWAWILGAKIETVAESCRFLLKTQKSSYAFSTNLALVAQPAFLAHHYRDIVKTKKLFAKAPLQSESLKIKTLLERLA